MLVCYCENETFWLLIFQSHLFFLIVNKHCHCFVFLFYSNMPYGQSTFVRLTTKVFVLCRLFPCFFLFHMLFILYAYIYIYCKYWQFYLGVLTPYVLFLHVSFTVDQMFCGMGVKCDLHIFSDSDKYAELCKLHSMYVCKMLYISTCPS